MIDYIPALITVIVSCLLMTIGFSFLPSVSGKKQLYFKNSIVFGAIMTVSALVLSMFIPSVTHMEAVPSPLTAATVTICGFCGIVLTRYLHTVSLRTFVKRIGIAAIIVFFIEAFVCNFNRFTSDKNQLTQPLLSMANTADEQAVSIGESSVTFSSDATISFDLDTNENVRAVSLKFDGDDKWIKATISMTDENFGNSPISVGSKFFNGKYNRPLWFSIEPYKTLKKLTVTVTELQSPVTLTAMTFDGVMPYYFSDIRFFAVFLLTAIVLAIVTFKFYKSEYNCKKIAHRIVLAVTAIVCSASMLIFLVPEAPDNEPIKYEKGMDVYSRDPYVQMFDALQKEQTALDIEPSDPLKALDNPYDYSERDVNNVDFLWDRAYYKGKYYSYYPITPVIMFYYPYHFVSGGYLPDMNKTTVFFAVIGVLFMTGALLAFVKRFNKHPNFLLLILSVIACTVAGGFYLGTNYSSQYTLPAVVSSAFLMMCLWCGVSGYNSIKSRLSPLLFMLSGLGFVLCVSARPTKSISALILAPLFIAVLIRKDHTIKTKITSAACFLLPVVIGMTAIMAYNHVRFDSFFEFGQSYQLTVSNIQANHIDLALLPNSFLHYFMQPMNLSGDFPYFSPNYSILCNNGKYMYEASNFGVFNFPLILLGTLAMPFFVWHTRHRKNACAYTYNNNRVRNYTYVLMFLLMILVAFADYCVGGAIDAYIIDILPVMMFMSVLVLMSIQEHIKKFPVFEGKSVCIISLTSFATIVIAFMMLLTIRDYRKLLEHYPDLFSEFERIICFWH